jgi:Iron-regulated ABC transporter membrane component SufB
MGAQAISFDYSKYNFRDEVQPVYSTKPGLSEEVVDEISRLKDEPEWMRRKSSRPTGYSCRSRCRRGELT